MVRRFHNHGQLPTADAIDAFLQKLRSDSIDEKLEALNQLSVERIPSDAFELADCLLSLLQSVKESDDVRIKAATVLAHSFNSTRKYALALFAALDDANEQIPAHIAPYVTYLPRETGYVPELLSALRHKSAKVRNAAIQTLAYGPFDSQITREIIAFTSSSDPQLRYKAINALASISGKSLEQAIVARDTLISALKDTDRLIHFSAAKGLRRMEEMSTAADQIRETSTKADQIFETCTEADQIFETCIKSDLESSDQNTRSSGMRELTESPKGSKKFVARLIELLDGTESDLFNAIMALEKLGPDAEAAIPALKRVLYTKSRTMEAAKALATLGRRDQEIIDWLARRCLASYPYSSGSIYCAARGLANFGKAAIPTLIKGLEWDNFLVQSNCAKALGIIGPDAVEAVPHLLEILDIGGGQPTKVSCGAEPSSEVLETLLMIAPEDEIVRNRVRAIARDQGDTRCNAALKALRMAGLDATTGVEVANTGTGTHVPTMSLLSATIGMLPKSLKHDTQSSAQSSAAMLAALSDPDAKVRQAAAAMIPPDVVRGFLINLCSSPGRACDVALHSLEFLDPNDLAPTLLKLLPSRGIDSATKVIERIGENKMAAVPPLLRQVHEGHAMSKLKGDKQFGHRSDVLDALARIAPDDERVLECLASLSAERHEHFQNVATHMAQAAIAALTEIGSERALAIIKETEQSS